MAAFPPVKQMFAEAAFSKSGADEVVTIETLRSEHLDAVYAFASRRLRREDAEDATCETFQAAIDCLHRRRGQDPRLWLLGIARRKVADALRRSSRRREVPLEDWLVAPGNKALERTEAEERLRKIVMALPEDQRDALLLQNLESLSIAQIAEVMDKTPVAVNSLLQRARARVLRQGRSYFLDSEVNQ
jgi:RNA polymerase sigma-70 factor (ECF subfamily)